MLFCIVCVIFEVLHHHTFFAGNGEMTEAREPTVKVGWRSLMGGNGDTSVTGVVCCVLSCRAPISVYTICWHVYAHPSSCVTWF